MTDAAPAPATDATDATPAPATDATDATPAPATTPQTTAEPDAKLGEAGEKALAEFKTRARAAEKEAKAAKAELEKLRIASMDDQEKAVALARSEGEQTAIQKVGGRLVDAEVRIAAAGRPVDVDALLEGLDRARFLTEDGEPDTEAISTWVDRIAPAQPESLEPAGPLGAGLDLGQGSRQSTPIGDDAAFVRMLDDLVK